MQLPNFSLKFRVAPYLAPKQAILIGFGIQNVRNDKMINRYRVCEINTCLTDVATLRKMGDSKTFFS